MQCNTCTKALHCCVPDDEQCKCEVPNTGWVNLHPLPNGFGGGPAVNYSGRLQTDEIYHALWDEIHTQVQTPEQFADWVKRVPQFGCSCASWLRGYLKDNPPTGDLWRYGWMLHNAVNAKLSKAELSWAEFEQKYRTKCDT